MNIEPATSSKTVELRVDTFVTTIGDPTGIQDGTPIALAKVTGVFLRMGAHHVSDFQSVLVFPLVTGTLSGYGTCDFELQFDGQ